MEKSLMTPGHPVTAPNACSILCACFQQEPEKPTAMLHASGSLSFLQHLNLGCWILFVLLLSAVLKDQGKN